MSFDMDALIVKPQEHKERTSFYASDFNKPAFDIYHSFIGTEKTNPIKWYEMLRMGAGNGVEAQMLKVLKDSGVVNEDYDQNVQGKIEFVEDGIEVHGRVDAITKEGLPIEIKSINNKNNWDISAYKDGHPRENYVGQLAIYMHALGKDEGTLFVASTDGLNRFNFTCLRDGWNFTCGNVTVDLKKELDRWKKLYTEHIIPRVEPDPMEYHYKTPVHEIDWHKVSKDKISKARNNQAVIGDFQLLYSAYKDLWIEKQGATLGYTPDELAYIRDVTTGYTTWK